MIGCGHYTENPSCECNICACARLCRERGLDIPRANAIAEADAHDEAKAYDERNGRPGMRPHDAVRA